MLTPGIKWSKPAFNLTAPQPCGPAAAKGHRCSPPELARTQGEVWGGAVGRGGPAGTRLGQLHVLQGTCHTCPAAQVRLLPRSASRSELPALAPVQPSLWPGRRRSVFEPLSEGGLVLGLSVGRKAGSIR